MFRGITRTRNNECPPRGRKSFSAFFSAWTEGKRCPKKRTRERERGGCAADLAHNQANVSSRRVKYNFPRIIPELNDIHYADNRGGSQLFKPSDAVPLLKVSQIARGAMIPVISRPGSFLNKVFRNFPRHSRANNRQREKRKIEVRINGT